MTSVGSRKQCCAALGLVLWLVVSADAHIGDRLYPIHYISDEMLERIDLKDGSVEEWQELIGEPSMTMLDFTSLDPGISPDPSDLDFRIWLAWHDDPARFYVAYVASDDIYKNDHDYNAESWGLDFMAPLENLWVRRGGCGDGNRGGQVAQAHHPPVCWDSPPRRNPTTCGGNDAPDHGTKPVHDLQAVCV